MRRYVDISRNTSDITIEDSIDISLHRQYILNILTIRVQDGNLFFPCTDINGSTIDNIENLNNYIQLVPESIGMVNPIASFGIDDFRVSMGTIPTTVTSQIRGRWSATSTEESEMSYKMPMEDLEEIAKLKAKGKVKIAGKVYDLSNSMVVEDYFNKGKYVLKDYSRNCFTALGKDNKGLPDSIVYYNSNDGYKWITSILTPKNRHSEEQRFDASKLDILEANGYVEHLTDGKWYHNSWTSELKNSKQKGIFRKAKAFKNAKMYPDKKSQFHYGIDSPTYLISEGKKYTFGIELETCRGYLPIYLDNKLNYTCEYDGSLKDEAGNAYGGEYITGVLKGDMGFKHLKLLCSELSKRCSVNYKCGYHSHIGGVDFNQEFIVYFYKLCLLLEKEIFDTLPPSRRNNEYCKKLKKFNIDLTKAHTFSPVDYNQYIESIYNEILLWVSTKRELDSSVINKKNDHPRGAKCQYDHSSARYSWVNLVPALFNTRHNSSYTVEFRPAAGTTNYIKVRNWTLLCMAIVYVAENNKQLINSNKSLTIEDILRLAYPKKYQELLKYFDGRKAKFNTDVDNKRNEESEYKDEVEIDSSLSHDKL